MRSHVANEYLIHLRLFYIPVPMHQPEQCSAMTKPKEIFDTWPLIRYRHIDRWPDENRAATQPPMERASIR